MLVPRYSCIVAPADTSCGCGGRGVIKELDFFLLRTALRDRPKGPSTANRRQPPTANHCQPPPTANREPPTAANRQPRITANRHQPPIPNHQPLPPTTNRHQPPPTPTNRQSPTAHRPPPTANTWCAGGLIWENCVTEHFFFPLRTALCGGQCWHCLCGCRLRLLVLLLCCCHPAPLPVGGGCGADEGQCDGGGAGRCVSLLHAQVLEADACVLALGVRGLQGVVAQSPALAKRCPEVAAASGLGGIDVMAVRLWLDRYVPTDAPSNVFGRLEGLRGAGGTFFMLDQLQPDQAALWGGAKPQGSVLACDFYNASALLGLSDEDVVQLLMRELLPTAIPGVCGAAGAFCGRGHVAPPPPPTAPPPHSGHSAVAEGLHSTRVLPCGSFMCWCRGPPQ